MTEHGTKDKVALCNSARCTMHKETRDTLRARAQVNTQSRTLRYAALRSALLFTAVVVEVRVRGVQHVPCVCTLSLRGQRLSALQHPEKTSGALRLARMKNSAA